MKILLWSVLFFAVTIPESVQLHVEAQKHSAMKLLVMPIGKHTHIDHQLPFIKKALAFKGQFSVDVKPRSEMLNKKELMQLWQDGYPLVIFLDMPHAHTIDWRLYDTKHAMMIKGKKIQGHEHGRGLAYAVADSLWQELAGEPGFFSTKIAYCKEIHHGKKHYKHIYIADYDGSHEQVLVQTPTINIAPRWNKDVNRPLVFFSESTSSNVRMLAATMDKDRILASNFDGLNMTPTFSADGKTVIYCATKGQGNCQLYEWHNRVLKKLTSNEGNNICPQLTEKGDILYFSSDFESNTPSIYALDIHQQNLERITQSGYCVSPSFCQRNGLLAYSKMVNGVMQLFSYNPKTREHIQLTFDQAQKEECSWSPCGSYLMCPVDSGKSQRIALFNRVTKQYTYLTAEKDRCTYPSWSGIYNEYPVVA